MGPFEITICYGETIDLECDNQHQIVKINGSIKNNTNRYHELTFQDFNMTISKDWKTRSFHVLTNQECPIVIKGLTIEGHQVKFWDSYWI